MAIAVQSVSSNTTFSATSTILTKPAGLAVGDLMIACIFNGNTTTTIATKSGWTLVQNQTSANTTSISMQYRIAEAADVAASDFTFAGTQVYQTGAMLRVDGFATTAIVGASETDFANDTASGTYAFTATSTPTVASSLVVTLFGCAQGDGVTTMDSYTSTPSISFTEILDVSVDAGSVDPHCAAAYGTYSGSAEITAYGAVASAVNDDQAGILAIFSPRIDTTGTNALFEVSPTQFSQAGVAGTTGTNVLLEPIPDMFSQSGRGETPAVWTPEVKTPATWTPEIK